MCAQGTLKLSWLAVVSDCQIILICHAFIALWENVTQASPTEYCDTSSQMSRFVLIGRPLSGSDMHGDGP